MRHCSVIRAFALVLFVAAIAAAQQDRPAAQQGGRGASTPGPEHARQYKRLIIRNAMIIYGNAKPAYAPWTSWRRTA